MRVQKIKTTEEIQTGLVELSPFPYQHRDGPQKRMQTSFPSFVTALHSSNWKRSKGNAWCRKGVAFYTEKNETRSRVSLHFRLFFREGFSNLIQTDLEAVA